LNYKVKGVMTTGYTVVEMNNLYDNDPNATMLKKYIDKSNAQLDSASKCISWLLLIFLILVCVLSVYLFMKYT